jgi:tRNA dimethylallyltransferase
VTAAAVPRAVAILGPTACGKSELALRLAERMPIELISVDSAQVYRGMDIGTAKPSLAEQASVPHHLIDIRDPEQSYSVGEFRADCLALIEQIRARGALPVLVGGTMLYFRALFQGIAALPVADHAVRAALDARAAREGWPALHADLAVSDPQSAARIHPHDAQRIQRALEVLALTGRTLEQHWESATTLSSFGDWRFCALEPQRREQLHERIAQRLDAMLRAGFTEEVSNLLARGTLDERSPALRLVGYRQMLGFCLRRETLQESTQKALFATRQLAKRQLTWLRAASFFPSSGKLLKADPFDLPTMEQLPDALIKGM